MSHELDEGIFSHAINVRKLPKKGQFIRYEAPPTVLQAIAKAYDLIEVEKFSVECLVTPWKREGVNVTGTLKAKLVQPCAATADPLDQAVVEDLDYIFLPEGSRLQRPTSSIDQEIILDPMGDDIPDTFTGDSIDLAGPWLESFALGLDLFARIDGAEFAAEQLDRESDSPFAVLATLKSEAKKS